MKRTLLITFSQGQKDLLRREAQKVWPMEGCALLLGRDVGGIAEVVRVLMAENRDVSSVSFSIDPRFLLDAYTKAEAMGLELVSVFHSHAAPPRPSPLDLEYMELNPVVWAIMSMPSESFKAYQLIGGLLSEVAIRVEPGH